MKLHKFVLERDGVITHTGMEAIGGNAAVFLAGERFESQHYATLDAALTDHRDAELVWLDPQIEETHRTEYRWSVEPDPNGTSLASRWGKGANTCLDCDRSGYLLSRYRCEFAREHAHA